MNVKTFLKLVGQACFVVFLAVGGMLILSYVIFSARMATSPVSISPAITFTVTPIPTSTPRPTPTTVPTLQPTPTAMPTPQPTPIPLVDIAPVGSIVLAPGVSYYSEVLTAENIKTANPYLAKFVEFNDQHLHYVYFDLKQFEGSFITSERRQMGSFPMTAENTLEFSNRHNLDIAINGGCFFPYKGISAPYGVESGCGYSKIRLSHRSNGDNITPFADPGLALFISKDNHVSMFQELDEPWNVISGMNILVRAGNVVKNSGNRAPRTAVGISQDGRYMFWVVVEGRQWGHAQGMYLGEIGWLMKNIGAFNAVNFDGGGSSTLVINGEVMNHLPPQNKGRPRTVGTHLGAWFSK